MRTLFKNGYFVNVFSCQVQKADILVEDDRIARTGNLAGDDSVSDLDEVIDLNGKVVCPGFMDSHIHIESSKMTPWKFAQAALPHGTTAVVADPHEIANVCGTDGLQWMLETSKNLPVDFFFMLPSCVPCSPFESAGATLLAKDLKPLYKDERILGLGEVMSFPAVLAGEEDILQKIADAKAAGRRVDGHAPLLEGNDLDKYIFAGVENDHECSLLSEAVEKISKGMMVMVREGTAAKNLAALIDLFQFPWADRIMVCSDDKHCNDLLQKGHVNHILAKAVSLGADPVLAVRSATWNPARFYHLNDRGAIAPGMKADLTIVNDLSSFAVDSVWKNGKQVFRNGEKLRFDAPDIETRLAEKILNTFFLPEIEPEKTLPGASGIHQARVIQILPDSLITPMVIETVDFDVNSGIDAKNGRAALCLVNRHDNSGDIAHALVKGTGLKKGAIASSVNHDSHNIICAGVSGDDMAAAINRVRSISGGIVIAEEGQILAELPLPAGGLMSMEEPEHTAARLNDLKQALARLGVTSELLMTLAFLGLPVIPHLKLSSRGLILDASQPVSLVVE